MNACCTIADLSNLQDRSHTGNVNVKVVKGLMWKPSKMFRGIELNLHLKGFHFSLSSQGRCLVSLFFPWLLWIDLASIFRGGTTRFGCVTVIQCCLINGL